MNRYELKDCNCILAFSGGADCVATLQWLLHKGKRPYIFFYEQKSNHNPYYTDAIKKIKEWYQVPVITWTMDVQSQDNGFADRERTRDWIQKTTRWAGKDSNGANPMLAKWATVAYWINFNNPWITEIYWGYVTGGLLEIGDGGADCLFNYDKDGKLVKQDRIDGPMNASNYDDRHKTLFDGLLNNLRDYGINSQFLAPLAHKTKLDLFKLIPKPVQEMVVTNRNSKQKTKELTGTKEPKKLTGNQIPEPWDNTTKLTTISKKSKWITNLRSRTATHLIRSKYDSILSTSSSINKDNSLLNCRIEGFDNNKPVLTSENKKFRFDKIVIACGAFSKRLTDQLDEKIPLDTERGYHIHFKDCDHLLSRPVIFSNRGFGITPMEQGLRVVGTVEFGGLENPLSKSVLGEVLNLPIPKGIF